MTEQDKLEKYGQPEELLGREGSHIQILTVIGEIEGHECLAANSKTTKYEHVIPMLAAVQAHLPFLAGFYSIVIILGIFTTATGQLFILADRFSQQGTKKFYAIVFGTVVFGIATGSFIPFTTIVNIVYSVLGLSGVILSVFLLVKIIRVRRSGAAEAG